MVLRALHALLTMVSIQEFALVAQMVSFHLEELINVQIVRLRIVRLVALTGLNVLPVQSTSNLVMGPAQHAKLVNTQQEVNKPVLIVQL